MPSKTEEQSADPAILRRLDVLIRLNLETLIERKTLKSEGDAARLFKSLGLTPTEIAKILGKKSATDVSKYLYSRGIKR